jgi:LysM repeat protein
MNTSRINYPTFKRWGICAGLSLALLFPTMAHAETYQVQPGDSLWKLSQTYGVSIHKLREENNLHSDMLLVGQTLTIPSSTTADVPTSPQIHTVKSGESLFIISQQYGITVQSLMKLNGLTTSMINVGQKLHIPSKFSTNTSHSYSVVSGDSLYLIAERYQTTVSAIKSLNSLTSDSIWVGQILKIPVKSGNSTAPIEQTKPAVTYLTHIVQPGDTLWNLSIDYDLPPNEIAETNGLNSSISLEVGQKLKVPVHHIPVKPVAAPQYGELLDWWTEAQYVWPRGTNAKVIDLETGVSWMMKRTYGAFHADVEPLTSQDTQIMKSVWGGQWSWQTRAVIVEVNEHRIAASASAMPHSIEEIKDNHFTGHSDIHFLNSRRHKDNKIDYDHQAKIQKAAGQQ